MTPNDIIELAEAATTTAQAYDAARAALKLSEARIYLGVCLEAGDNGKARYTNDTAREAATTIRLAEDTEHQALTARLRDTEIAKAAAAARLEACREALKLQRAELLARVETQ